MVLAAFIDSIMFGLPEHRLSTAFTQEDEGLLSDLFYFLSAMHKTGPSLHQPFHRLILYLLAFPGLEKVLSYFQ